jgi:hypothetical protein
MVNIYCLVVFFVQLSACGVLLIQNRSELKKNYKYRISLFQGAMENIRSKFVKLYHGWSSEGLTQTQQVRER